MNLAALFPQWPGVMIDDLESNDQQITIYAHSIAQVACCPVCQHPSTGVHSVYERHPADVSVWGKKARWVIEVRRFFCRNSECVRKVFSERLAPRLPVYARRTSDLAAALEAISRSTSAEVGSGLTTKLALSASSSTLLRIVRHIRMPSYPIPRVLGVDDWAFRRGHRYGTLLCDLERRCVIELLPERSAESLAAWLQAHPGIEIISRDRSDVYASGIAQGAPNALQILDRWHLLKNAGEAVDAVLRHYRQYLLKSVSVTDPDATVALTNLSGKRSAKEKKRLKNEAKRRARYERIHQRHAQGVEVAVIAQELGISVRLTNQLLAAPSCPTRQRPPVKEGILEPFLADLTKRYEAGCPNTMQLWRELTQLGFTGSYATVHKAVCRLQQGLPAQRTVLPTPSVARQQRYTVRQAKWLFTAQPDQLTAEDAAALAAMLQHTDLARLYQLTQDFSAMIRTQRIDQLDSWLLQARTCSFSAFRRLSRRLQQEYSALKAAITLPWSSGQVEGQVNRLKLIKREMYGRANFDLLRQRVLLPR